MTGFPQVLHIGCILLALLGCNHNGDVTPEERLASQQAYEALLEATPDSVLAAMPPVDSLFLSYRPPAFVLQPIDTTGAQRWVDSTLAAMSIEERVGQLFIVNLQDRGLKRWAGGVESAIENYHVGGFLLPRLMAPREVFETTQALQRRAGVPLFFAADYERGVGRFNNALTELPSNMALGATRDTVFAAAAGRLTAIESRTIGVNLLFAPVVDVNNNPDNPIINIRSYGESPELVGAMATAFVREAQAQGLLTTLKHFPGHGNTSIDSHARMGTIPGDSASLAAIELMPYRMVFEEVMPAAVMTAHLWIEALEPDPLPATFSRPILTGLLRERMGFDGIVITDDVQMGALQNQFSLQERTVRPLLAGGDIVLTPANLPRAIEAVLDALRSGRLSEDALNASVRRILTAKARIGLHRNRFADRKALETLLSEPFGAYLSQAIADRAVTLLRTSPVLPLRPDSQRIALVQLTNYEGSENIAATMSYLSRLLGEDDYALDVRFDRAPSRDEAQDVLDRARGADVVVLALYLRLQAGRGEAGLFPPQQRLAERLLALDVPVVLLTFGNPYAAGTFSTADAILVAYEQTLESASAAAGILRGEQQPMGRLPITVDPFPFGSGLDAVQAQP